MTRVQGILDDNAFKRETLGHQTLKRRGENGSRGNLEVAPLRKLVRLRVEGSEFGVEGLGSRIEGLGLRV